MKIRMKQNFDDREAGKEYEVDSGTGIYLQSTGVADVIEHDAPRARAKASKMTETVQSKAVQAQIDARKPKGDE